MQQKQPHFVSSRHYLDVAECFLNIGFWSADMATGELRGSDGFYRILALSKDEPFSLHQWLALLHPDDREDFRSLYSTVNTGVSTSLEVRMIDQERPARRIVIAVEESRTTTHMVGLVKNPSAEREAKIALQSERARLNALIEMAGGIFWIRDLHGVVSDVRNWDKITGQTYAERAALGWLDAVHPDDLERVKESRKACTSDGVLHSVSYRLRYADGQYRDVLAHSAPIRRADGEVLEWAGLIEETWRGDRTGVQSGGLPFRPQQLRAARALLGWSAETLALESGVSTATIRRYEATGESMKNATYKAITAALERHGLVLTASSTEMGLKLRHQDGSE